MIRQALTVLTLSILFFNTPLQGSLLIDDFTGVGSGTAINLEANTLISSVSQTQGAPLSGSISNNRHATLTHLGILGSASALQTNTILGIIRIDDVAAFDTVEFSLDYNNLGGINTQNYGNLFSLNVDNASVFLLGSLTWEVRVTDTFATSQSTGFSNLTTGLNTLATPLGVDTTSIERIILAVRAQNFLGSETASITEFAVIPEPSYALTLVGLAILVVSRKMFRRQPQS